MTTATARRRSMSTLIAASTRYQKASLEYFALKVVGRGLFPIFMLMVGFLFVFAYVTDLFVGVNEVVVPTVDVEPGVDLGNLVASTFFRVSGAVVSIGGVHQQFVDSAESSAGVSASATVGDSGPSGLLNVWTLLLLCLMLLGGLFVWLVLRKRFAHN